MNNNNFNNKTKQLYYRQWRLHFTPIVLSVLNVQASTFTWLPQMGKQIHLETTKGYSIKRFHDPCKGLILSCVTLSLKIRPKRFNMGATCAKCCLCYCFKLCEFGERFRCCPCCIHNCGPCCQFGDCCDVEGDSLPFVEASENLKEEDAVVYTNRDKNIGEMKNDKRYGYGEIICKDSSR